MSIWEKFEETKLPPKIEFSIKLNMKRISDQECEYVH